MYHVNNVAGTKSPGQKFSQIDKVLSDFLDTIMYNIGTLIAHESIDYTYEPLTLLQRSRSPTSLL